VLGLVFPRSVTLSSHLEHVSRIPDVKALSVAVASY
jgi:hypothetical protein